MRTVTWLLFFILSSAECLPMVDTVAHDGMEGMYPRAGIDALNTHQDTMEDIVECDGELGAESEIVEVWPSPGPLPSNSPIPSLQSITIVAINLTSNATSNVTQPRAPVKSSIADLGNTCQDDEAFMDSKGMNCRDYTMNKELCKIADRFINHNGKTARHACCKCGGGVQVVAIPTKKCVRPQMGGDGGCEEEKYATLGQRDNASPFLGEDSLDPESTLKMGGGNVYDEVVAEDEIEENALNTLGTVSSMDGVLEPDSVVFRDRNFIGYPREPETSPHQINALGFYDQNLQYATTTYIVQQNETVASIAEKFGITPALLVSFNEDIADPSMIAPGEILLVPTPRLLEVDSVFPNISPLEGGIETVIRGTGFVYPGFCKFGDRIVTADYVVDDIMTCEMPEQKEPGSYPFSVSDGKGGFLPTSFSVQYSVGMIPFCDEPAAKPMWCRPRLAIYSVLPIRIPQDTAEILEVVGTGFNASTVCNVGGNPVPTTVWSRTNVTCTMPPSPPGVYSLVLTQGSMSATTKYEIVVYSTLTILSIDPTNGPEKGGTIVTITGSTIKQGAYCRFGEVLVVGQVVNSTTMICVSPASDPKIVQIDISNDGKVFSASSVPFEYTYLRLDGVSPNYGGVSGGSIIEVHGYGFYPNMWCRFGQNQSMAQYVNLTTAYCKTPPQLWSSTVRVSLSLDGQRLWTDNELFFNYLAEVTSIHPTKGLAIGGDLIHVNAVGYNPFCSYTCQFGSTLAPATVVSSVGSQFELTCVSPKVDIPGTVQFAVSCNTSCDPTTQSWLVASKSDDWGMWYEYVANPPFSISLSSPRMLSTMGGIPVVVQGAGFDATSHCVFGDTTVRAQYFNESYVRCLSPPHIPGDYEFRVVLFSQSEGFKTIFTIGITFAPPTLLSITPSEGYVTGGKLIAISGSLLSGAVSCVIGRIQVPVQSVTDSEVTCITPPVEVTSIVPVQLVFGTAGQSVGDVSFIYRPIITSVTPPSGYVLTDKQDVVFQGEGFNGDPTQCVFGDAEFVPATIISNTEVSCAVPVSSSPHSTTLWLANSRQERVGGQVFTYKYNPVIQDLHPTVGSTAGGTIVIAIGSGLSSITDCSFDGALVSAKVVSDIMVHCLSPFHAPGSVAVKLLANTGLENSTFVTNSFQFTYKIMTTQVDSVFPTSGPIAGGNLITVRGNGFTLGSFCRFGEIEVPAIYFSPDHIACYAPQVAEAKTVTVEVSQLGSGEGYSEDGWTYTYQTAASAQS